MGKHLKIKKKKRTLLNLVTIICLLGIIISTSYIIKWYKENRENKDLENKLADIVVVDENKEGSYNINFKELKNINNEVIGWLRVNGTKIEYVVVKGTDNSYYLDHNFEKKNNSAGWIFADYKNKFDGTDKNIIIYGHNRKDNSMFGSLKNILTEEWYSNADNLIIDFITENEHHKYQVFSVYKIENEDYYIDTEFGNKEFQSFINVLKNRSIKDFNVNISSGDSILTLSTCANNNKYRVVLHAVRIK